jgi:hypothetical protein
MEVVHRRTMLHIYEKNHVGKSHHNNKIRFPSLEQRRQFVKKCLHSWDRRAEFIKNACLQCFQQRISILLVKNAKEVLGKQDQVDRVEDSLMANREGISIHIYP